MKEKKSRGEKKTVEREMKTKGNQNVFIEKKGGEKLLVVGGGNKRGTGLRKKGGVMAPYPGATGTNTREKEKEDVKKRKWMMGINKRAGTGRELRKRRPVHPLSLIHI